MSDPEVAESGISDEVIVSQSEPKKIVDEKRLAQLAKARERAAFVNRQKKEQRLRDKVAALDGASERSEPLAEDAVASRLDAGRPEQHASRASATQPIVVVEQSDSDPEEFEAPGVVFVRRKRPKPRVPEKTQEELQMDKLYSHMFG